MHLQINKKPLIQSHLELSEIKKNNNKNVKLAFLLL